MSTDWVSVAVVAALAGLFRAIPRTLRAHAYVSDTYFHLYYAELLRTAGFRLPERDPRTLLPHRLSYPYFYHLVIAAFPRQLRNAVERYTGSVCDAALAAAAGSAAILVNQASHSRVAEPVVAAALVAVLPGLLRSTGGPRAFSGSPRVVGQLLLAAHFLLFALGCNPADLPLLFAAALLGALIFLTSKFCVQAYLATIGALVLLSPHRAEIILVALISWLLALAISGGKAWRIAQGHLAHSRFYTQTLQSIFIEKARPRLRRTLIDGAVGLRNLVLRRDGSAMMQWLARERHPIFVLSICFPTALIGATLIPAMAGDIGSVLGAWLAAMLTAFAATSTRPLLFLGEAERYLEYGAVPAAVLSSIALAGLPAWAAPASIVVLGLIGLALVVEYCRSAAASHEAEADRIAGFAELNRQPAGTVWPIGSFHWQALYLARHPVLTIGVNIDTRFLDTESFLLVYGNYPYPSARFEEIIRRYSVRFIVSDTAHLQHYVGTIAPAAAELVRSASVVHRTAHLTILALPVSPAPRRDDAAAGAAPEMTEANA